MTKVDKDGSGAIEAPEFLALMAEQIETRNQEEELRKVFRIYDDDDNGQVTKENLRRCAKELYADVGEVTDEQIEQMIAMADHDKKGFVDVEDFIQLMKEVGLIKEKDQEEYKEKKANEEREAKRRAELGNFDYEKLPDDPILRKEMLDKFQLTEEDVQKMKYAEI